MKVKICILSTCSNNTEKKKCFFFIKNINKRECKILSKKKTKIKFDLYN